LECSLFQRLIDSKEIEAFTLGVQYRMHPSISQWPSKHFYSGTIADGIPASARPAPPGITWPDSPEKRVVFIPSSSPETHSPDKSYLNNGEADTVVELIKHLFSVGITCNSIGVITPYSAQVRSISDRIRNKCGVDVDCFRTGPLDDDDDKEEEGKEDKSTKRFISVYSVDGFQGREKDIIIFSAVRSNSAHVVGFLSDWRRSNVMLTRARNALFVIGNPETLEKDEHWKLWLDYVKENNLSSSLSALFGVKDDGKHPKKLVPERRERTEGGEQMMEKKRFKPTEELSS